MKSDKYIVVCGNIITGNELYLIKSLGYKSILINSNTWISLDKALEADVPVEVNLNDEEKVLKKIDELKEKYNIVAVFTLHEYRVPMAAKIKEHLGLPYGLSYEAAMKCRNKKATRKTLKGLGKDSVKHAIIRTLEEAKAFVNVNGLPVVIKPSNDAGSKLVACCSTMSEVEEAVSNIRNVKTNLVDIMLDPEFLIEEFLDGPEFSVETITYQGEPRVIAITSKKILSQIAPIEVGHTVPASLDLVEEESIKSIVIKAHKLLGISDTVTHTEIILTKNGPRIVEVNARPGGDNISLLVEAVTGVNLYASNILLALGKDIITDSQQCTASKADIRYFIAEEDGYARISDLSDIYNNAKVKKIDLNIKHGMQVKKSTNNYDRLGWFICFDEEDEIINEIAQIVEVQKEPLQEILPEEKISEKKEDWNLDNFQKMNIDISSKDNISAREYAMAVLMRGLLSDSDHKKVRAVIYAKSIGISNEEIYRLFSSVSDIDQILNYKSIS
ncbi:ATP-grasp domain-containing protein [Vallitalea sp.]|jgi:biotin carboxylase|uniref:ATP-grasp domain-containing protein n=1 Tax=Vallitalea sp. TaxID=1882829 RepID=UPI0025F27342|nr:ATP-grasp domain-containing protein [Vallitalea sp.]MCT4688867.1 ATP-grasp domain-containing protein [Vallitalea sp.]